MNKIKGLCQRCKKNKATLQFAEGLLEATHGFIEYICQECYNKIRDNNAWYKEGIQEGKKEAIKILREMESSNTEFSENRAVESYVELAIEKIEEKND